MHRRCLYPELDDRDFDAIVREVKELYGDGKRIYAGSHHARLIDENVPHHIISRVFQGRHLLRPCPKLNRIIVGVLGRGLELYGQVRLFAIAVMGNHLHMMLQGPADQVSAFVAYLKREISRRWGGNPEVEWSDSMWSSRYIATALPTAESQVSCLRYILSQGVKEGLVARPQDWPGVHCARTLLSGTKLRGEWLDSTAWSRARYDAKRRADRRIENGELNAVPDPVPKAAFLETYRLDFAPIPPWRHLAPKERCAKVREMVDDIIHEGRQARGGRPPLGVEALLQTPLDRRTALPPPPWFEDRKRMICWSDPKAKETRAYLDMYWAFQRGFRAASAALRAGDLAVAFPPGAFRPLTFNRPTAPSG